jgi:outer membrane protein assembly factor BamA
MQSGVAALAAWSLAACFLAALPGAEAAAQEPPAASPGPPAQSAGGLSQWEGLTVRRITFAGVDADRLQPLPADLPLKPGAVFSRSALQATLRALYATGLYDDVQAEGERAPEGLDLVFRGQPRKFIGTVTVDGAKGATLNTQLQRASQLTPGTRYTQAKLDRALNEMRTTLAVNGFMQPSIRHTLSERQDYRWSTSHLKWSAARRNASAPSPSRATPA